MPAALPPFPEPTRQARPHPLAHLHNKEAPPAPPAWLAPARMVWHSDPSAVDDPQRPEDEAFNGAWSRLFDESWPSPVEGELTQIPDALDKFETADALYNLFPRGRIVIVYASSAMAICLTDAPEAIEAHPAIAELGAMAPAEVDAPPAPAEVPSSEPPAGDDTEPTSPPRRSSRRRQP